MSTPVSFTVRHAADPLLAALTLTPIPGSFDFGDTSFSRFQWGVICLSISIVVLVSVCAYLYSMAFQRTWQSTPSAYKYRQKQMYEHEDDQKMRLAKEKR